MTLDHHSERVAHQQDVDAGLIERAGEGCVITGEHGDFLAGVGHLLKSPQRHGLAEGVFAHCPF